jgi:hypothetical protein
VLSQNADAMAYAMLTFAYSTEAVNGVLGQPVPEDDVDDDDKHHDDAAGLRSQGSGDGAAAQGQADAA